MSTITTDRPAGGTITLDRPDSRELPTVTDEGDHDRFSHYVPKRLLGDALVFGTPVKALCGKMWVPHRAPEKFPVCPDCKAKWEAKDPS